MYKLRLREPQPGLGSFGFQAIGLRYVRDHTYECASQFVALWVVVNQTVRGNSQCGEHGECEIVKTEHNIGEAHITPESQEEGSLILTDH